MRRMCMRPQSFLKNRRELAPAEAVMTCCALKMLLTYVPPSPYSPPLIKVTRLGLFHL